MDREAIIDFPEKSIYNAGTIKEMKNTVNNSVRPRLVIMVAYKKNGQDGWRAFCAPYDVSCNAPTLKEAQSRIENLVELYEEGLKEYGFPKHLSVKPLSYPEDKKVFKLVVEEVAADMKKTIEKRFESYQTESHKTIRVSAGSATPARASYYSPQLVTA